MDAGGLKQRALARIDELEDVLLDVSHQIHAHPELNFEERFAHELLTSVLEGHGLDVTRHAYGLDTAFAATAGADGPTVAICLEYDALPGVGHACGHNVIAAAGLGAGLAAAAIAEEAGGRVRILGTPAEEGGGGKAIMADAGAFDGLVAAMMVHPADADLAAMDVIATSHLRVEFRGVAAHAAAFPHLGRNALDAAVLGYVNVAALRQHIEPTDRVHGVFTDGGDKPNIVPERTEMEWMVRSARYASLEPLQRRVEACFEAGAAAAGCTCTYEEHGRRYADMVDNPVLLARFAANSEALGRPLADPRAGGPRVVGSTDMGNVSYLVPSIHPMVKVAPAGVSIHSHDFTAHARSEAGDAAVLHGARAMAATVADLWADRALREQVAAAFAPGTDPGAG
jgi:amidohydrolase